MRKLLTLIFLLITTYYVNGQDSNDTLKYKGEAKNFETAPKPKGGIRGFMKFLSSNIAYPKDARDQKKEGQVLVEFVVSSDGTVKSESVRIVEGVFESLDNEAKRVITLSPKWIPGTRNGHPIDMRIVMPINFKL